VTPPYESFRVSCEQTFLAPRCDSGEVVQFTVRLRDGRSFAQGLPLNAPPAVLLQGGFITGPAETPLGFYRVLANDEPAPMPSPPNLAPDPLQTIATVTATGHVYDVELAGEVTLDGRRCYHLTLRPQIDPDRYPLRELWVTATDFEVAQLAYQRPYAEHAHAHVLYRFAPVGPERVWTIVHIEAQASVPGFFSTKTERVSEDLSDLNFPGSAPDWYFQPPR
jgi:hypothetical protein